MFDKKDVPIVWKITANIQHKFKRFLQKIKIRQSDKRLKGTVEKMKLRTNIKIVNAAVASND